MVNKKSPAANTEMLYLVTLQDYQRGRFKNRLIVYVCVCVCVCRLWWKVWWDLVFKETSPLMTSLSAMAAAHMQVRRLRLKLKLKS